MTGTDLSWLLERDTELEALREAVENVRSGGLVLIEGGPGIGKSSLVDAGAELAREAGLQVLMARGSQLEIAFSFGVVRQLLERPLVTAPDEERAELLAGAAALGSRSSRSARSCALARRRQMPPSPPSTACTGSPRISPSAARCSWPSMTSTGATQHRSATWRCSRPVWASCHSSS